MKAWIWKIWAVCILPAFAVAAQGAVLYDNSTTDTGYVLVFPNNLEVGDQIWLANYLTDPYLTSFSFEYYSSNTTFSGTVTADVRFRLNDGPTYNGYNSPGSVFYDTGPFEIPTPQSVFPGTNAAVLSFSLSDIYAPGGPLQPMTTGFQMPSNFTITVTFQGLSVTDQAGLPSFEPPAVGTNYQNYWENDGGYWQLETNSIGGVLQPVGFAVQLYGTDQPIPEPSTLCLAAVGAALLAGFARRRRQ
jgi:hypothetical protein